MPESLVRWPDNRGRGRVGSAYSDIIPDVEAAQHGCIRVMDESGEDYGYAAKCPAGLGGPGPKP